MSRSNCEATMATLPRHTFHVVVNATEDGSKLGFSWAKCELCGALPGDRYLVHAVIPGKCDPDPYDFEVCADCMYYVTYGEGPDEWMSA